MVGRQLAPLLATQEQRALLIAGRTERNAAATLAAVRGVGGDASYLRLDLGAQPERRVAASAIVGLVNDPRDSLLSSAVSARVPFVDITRWTPRVAAAVARIALAGTHSPVVLASGWMAGLVARTAAFLAKAVGGQLEAVEGSVRYALADASGADSVDYIDRLWIPFDVTQDGAPITVLPLGDARRVEIAGHRTTVRQIDTPDQWSLPLTLGARSATLRLGFDSAIVGAGLALITRVGFFHWFASERFRGLRHAVLRGREDDSRPGAAAAFRVDVSNTGTP